VTDERQSQVGWIGVPGGKIILTSLLSREMPQLIDFSRLSSCLLLSSCLPL
jgi:hypothetical protein